MTRDDYRGSYYETSGTKTIKTGRGTLHTIVVGTTAAGAIEVYDGVDGGVNTKLAELKASITEGTYTFDCNFANGLFLIMNANSKITVTWR